ncbi:DUF554 domain-containing protein [Nostoc sp.]|uniref:DUF554 domain-containing protein n=1 Tax=Nostoc sp. TaxID=1180 RepID=UPI002FFBA9AE
MTLNFWSKTNGIWINAISVVFGTSVGILLKNSFSLQMQITITQGVALMTLFIGSRMTNNLAQVQNGRIDGVVLGLLAIVLGGVLGDWLQIEGKLHFFGDLLKLYFQGNGNFTEGFVTGSLLFCIGPLAVIGSLNNGLTGNNSLLLLKATMDGLAAIALSSSLGIGVGFSTFVILFYQGFISIIAGFMVQIFPNTENDPRLLLLTGVGGLMVVGLGINLLEITHIRVASFLPALVIAPLLYSSIYWISLLKNNIIKFLKNR